MALYVVCTRLMEHASTKLQTAISGGSCCIDAIDIEANVSTPGNSSTAVIQSSSLVLDSVVRQSTGALWVSIIDALATFPRHIRNQLVPCILGVIGGTPADLYRRTLEQEGRHIATVREVMRTAVGIENNKHDFSKDPYYVFTLCGHYGGVEAKGERFEAEFKAEISRHYTLEPHHPEYEEIHIHDDRPENSTHCNDLDLAEMAVDRLHRNFSSSDGRDPINWDTMHKYQPVFTVGNVDNKCSLYNENLRKFEAVVRSTVIKNLHVPLDVLFATVEADYRKGDDDTKVDEDAVFVADSIDYWGPDIVRLCSRHYRTPDIKFISGRVKLII